MERKETKLTDYLKSFGKKIQPNDITNGIKKFYPEREAELKDKLSYKSVQLKLFLNPEANDESLGV